jgi:hypothetical protein
MSIQRSGTPQRNQNASGLTVNVTVPSDAIAGATAFILARINKAQAWGSAPAGWSVVNSSDQHTANPSTILYTKVLVAGDLGASVTITSTGTSGILCTICFAYTNVAAIDAFLYQSNGSVSSTTATSPSITPTGMADLLVMMYSTASIGTSFSTPSEGTIWQNDSTDSFCIADFQLSSNAATGNQTVTMNVSHFSQGWQMALLEVDDAGVDRSARRITIPPFGRLALFNGSNLDDEFLAALAHEPAFTPRPPRFRPFQVARFAAGAEAYVASITDEDFARPPFVKLRGLRPGRPGDEQPPLVALITDESQSPLRQARSFAALRMTERAAGHREEPIAAPAEEGVTTPRRARIVALRRVPQALENHSVEDDAPAPASRPPRFAALRTAAKGSGRNDDQIVAPEDNPAAAPTARIARFKQYPGGRFASVEPIILAGEEPEIATLPQRLWRWAWRRVREVIEDLGLVVPPAQAPRIVLRPTLDQPIITALSCDPAVRFNNTLDPPIVFGAKL